MADPVPPRLDVLKARIEAGRASGGEFMNGAKPHHGEFASFAICDNIITLAGREALAAPEPRKREGRRAQTEKRRQPARYLIAMEAVVVPNGEREAAAQDHRAIELLVQRVIDGAQSNW